MDITMFAAAMGQGSNSLFSSFDKMLFVSCIGAAGMLLLVNAGLIVHRETTRRAVRHARSPGRTSAH